MSPKMQETLQTLSVASSFNPQKLALFIGAKGFLYDNEKLSLMFSFPRARTNKGSVNKCVIAYNQGKDLFDMTFYYVHNGNCKEVYSFGDLYTEDLKRVFETTTNLYLSFR